MKVSIDQGNVTLSEIKSECISYIQFVPEQKITIKFQKSDKYYTYKYNKTFKDHFFSILENKKSIGSFVSKEVRYTLEPLN